MALANILEVAVRNPELTDLRARSVSSIVSACSSRDPKQRPRQRGRGRRPGTGLSGFHGRGLNGLGMDMGTPCCSRVSAEPTWNECARCPLIGKGLVDQDLISLLQGKVLLLPSQGRRSGCVQCPCLITSTERTGSDQLPDHGFRRSTPLRTRKSWSAESRDDAIRRDSFRLGAVCAAPCSACITTARTSDTANLLSLRNDQGFS